MKTCDECGYPIGGPGLLVCDCDDEEYDDPDAGWDDDGEPWPDDVVIRPIETVELDGISR